jgi:nucleoside-diphosphate-sugar epimerase
VTGMRVLVTGHDGYIGSVLTDVLVERGHDVVGADAGYYSEFAHFGSPPRPVRSCGGDVRLLDREALAGCDAVVHLAALSNDPLGDLRSEWTHEVNTLATVRLAELAREAGVERFVFASSCSVYGCLGQDEAATEASPLRPLTAYATSKVRAEEALSRLAGSRFVPVYLRNATVFGQSPRLRTDLVLNNLVGWAVTTGVVHLQSDGSAWRPLVDVTDVARAIAAVLEAPADVVRDEAFNVGSDAGNVLVRELAELVCELVPRARLHVAGRRIVDARSYRVDFRKLASALPGFECLTPLRAGVVALQAAMRHAGLSADELTGRRCTRLAQLSHLVHSGQLDDRLRWRQR